MTKKIYFLLTATLFLSYSAFCQVSPITEDFNSVSSLSSSGWSLINRSEPNTVATWSQGNTALFSAQSGAPNSYIQSYGNLSSNALISNWLITPQRTLHNGDIFTFYTRNLTSAREALEVRLTTAGNSSNVGNSVTSTGDFTTVLLTINPSLVQGQYPSSWTKYTYTLSGLSGVLQGRIAFRHINAAPTGGTADVAIDNFTYTAYPVASRLYVDSSAASGNNGLGWASPLKTLEEALSLARTYSNITEIWVKKGTYYPDEGPGRINDDQNLSFSLKNGLTIYGGFAGGEMTLNLRKPRTNATVLSGEIQQDNNTGNNAHHVIRTRGLNNTAVLDGFTVTAGNANGSSINLDDHGGGMFNYDSSPSLVNCTFSQNDATIGGGMFNYDSSPSLVNCSFSQNIAREGGGMYNVQILSPRLVNCTFSQNTADYGGGMCNTTFNSPSLVNCSFSQNMARDGGGIFNIFNSSSSLANCILWDNTNGQIVNSSNTATVSYSIVQGGYNGGTNNSDADPKFVDADHPAGADGIFGTADDGLRLQSGSPAINAGSNNSVPASITTDITGALRIQEDTVDMGAYESAPSITGPIIRVDSSIAISGDGSSWEKAVKTLNEALDAANINSSIIEIWVKKGTYYATTDGNRDSSFRIVRNGIQLYGGFAGNETALSARDYKTNRTLLSGDIGIRGDSTDNSQRIMIITPLTADPLDSSTKIDGFIFEKAYGQVNGGAILISLEGSLEVYSGDGTTMPHVPRDSFICSPAISNCVFIQNTVVGGGGAISMSARYGTSSPAFTNCRFANNNSAYGGAVYTYAAYGISSPIYNNCSFTSNRALAAGASGGAIATELDYGAESKSIFTNCSFDDNKCYNRGGAIYNFIDASVGPPDWWRITFKHQYINCIFNNNRAIVYTGAVANIFSGENRTDSTSYTNCTFTNNFSGPGGFNAIDYYSSWDPPLFTHYKFHFLE